MSQKRYRKPQSLHSKGGVGISLRLFSLIVASLLSMNLWGEMIVGLSGCSPRQSSCVGCYMAFRHLEEQR